MPLLWALIVFQPCNITSSYVIFSRVTKKCMADKLRKYIVKICLNLASISWVILLLSHTLLSFYCYELYICALIRKIKDAVGILSRAFV